MANPVLLSIKPGAMTLRANRHAGNVLRPGAWVFCFSAEADDKGNTDKGICWIHGHQWWCSLRGSKHCFIPTCSGKYTNKYTAKIEMEN